MFNWFKKKHSPIFDLPGIGVFSLVYPEYKSWFTRTELFTGEGSIELTIETPDGSNPTDDQIKSILALPLKHESIISLLFSYLERAHIKDGLVVDDLKSMYHLASIDLKADNKEWWYALEPTFDVSSIYDYFVRYTVINDKIVWSNLNI